MACLALAEVQHDRMYSFIRFLTGKQIYELRTMKIGYRKRSFTLLKMATKTENYNDMQQYKKAKYKKINLTAKKQSQYTKS